METKPTQIFIATPSPGFVVKSLLLIACLGCAVGPVSTSQAQPALDTIVVRRENSEQTLKRRGSIVQWQGRTLTLHSNGRDREIDNDQIVEVQTAWSQEYVDAVALFNQGQTKEAIAKFQTALIQESRIWAKPIIRSYLVEAFQMVEQPGSAIEQFLQIVRDDPQTRFLPFAPLPWSSAANSLNVQSTEQWLASREPVIQLIGASWLLGGPKRDEAIKTLESLTRDIDPRISHLAIAQLWRTRTNVNLKQTEVWRDIIEKMPRPVRGGPYFVLAEAQARLGQSDAAQISLMRIPILYSKQKSLSAAALYRTASLMHNLGNSEQAQSILNELVLNYPQTIWAKQATQ